MAKRINRDDIDKLHDYGIHIPSRTIFLETPCTETGEEHGVGYSMAQRVIKNLRILDVASADAITLIINTGGGDTFIGMGIYDAIRSCRAHVRGLVVGNACSMGSILLQACDERVATPYSTIMYHSGTLDGGSGAPLREGFRAVEYEKKHCEIIDRLVFARIREKKLKLTYEKFLIESDRGIYLAPGEAIEWGLLDSIEPPSAEGN